MMALASAGVWAQCTRMPLRSQLASSCSSRSGRRERQRWRSAPPHRAPPLLPAGRRRHPGAWRAGNPWRRENSGAAPVGQGRLGLRMEAARRILGVIRHGLGLFGMSQIANSGAVMSYFVTVGAAVGEQEARQVGGGKILP